MCALLLSFVGLAILTLLGFARKSPIDWRLQGRAGQGRAERESVDSNAPLRCSSSLAENRLIAIIEGRRTVCRRK